VSSGVRGRTVTYAVLSRADGWYVQAGIGERADTRPGWYALERQEGGLERHFRTEVSDLNEAIRMFTGFAAGDTELLRRFVWRRLTL